jgi:F-type H+-transporting ATPase subunit epsilon
MAQLSLRVITPEKIAVDTQVESVRLPLLDGSAGVLPRHAPMIAALDIGLLFFRTPGGPEQQMFVSGGFAEVRGDVVRVVTQAGERPEEIDEERALEAEKRARERLDRRMSGRSPGEAIDALRAETALKRALFRLRTKRGSR